MIVFAKELRARILPGFRPLVVRFVDKTRWYYPSEDERVRSVPELLEIVAA